MTFEQKLEWSLRASRANFWGKNIPDERNIKSQGVEMDCPPAGFLTGREFAVLHAGPVGPLTECTSGGGERFPLYSRGDEKPGGLGVKQ